VVQSVGDVPGSRLLSVAVTAVADSAAPPSNRSAGARRAGPAGGAPAVAVTFRVMAMHTAALTAGLGGVPARLREAVQGGGMSRSFSDLLGVSVTVMLSRPPLVVASGPGDDHVAAPDDGDPAAGLTGRAGGGGGWAVLVVYVLAGAGTAGSVPRGPDAKSRGR
jgi:hypothetical protein